MTHKARLSRVHSSSGVGTQGDKSVLDDLVLQAVADLPPPKLGGSIQDALAAGQASKTPSMRQQRTNLVQQLST